MAKVAKEMLNVIVVQTWDHDWNQISRDVGIKLLSGCRHQTSSGCRHQTSSRIAVAFKLKKMLMTFSWLRCKLFSILKKFWIRYLELK